jgi:hypothetical protein
MAVVSMPLLLTGQDAGVSHLFEELQKATKAYNDACLSDKENYGWVTTNTVASSCQQEYQTTCQTTAQVMCIECTHAILQVGLATQSYTKASV